MLEWVLVIVTVFNIFFGGYHGQQTQVRNYQTQHPQTLASPYGTQGTQGYYYGQPPQAAPYSPGY